MNNKLYFNEKLVIKEIRGKKRKKIFILEDGTVIEVAKNKFNIVCSICGKIGNAISIYSGRMNKKYVCYRCNQNKIWIGRHHTKESKLKQSAKMKGRYSGKNNPMFGKHLKDLMTPEKYKNWKNNIGIANSGENNGFYGKHHTEDAINLIKLKNKLYNKKLTDDQKKKRSIKLSHSQNILYKNNPTKYIEDRRKAAHASLYSQRRFKRNNIELKVKNWLDKNTKYNFESTILGYHQFDFGNKDLKVLIEVNGDYWHGNPKYFNKEGTLGKRKLNQMQLNKMSKDLEKIKFAKNHNFKLIVIWEDDINNHDFSILEELRDA